MICSIIVAVDEENGIGKDNQLLWHLPADMRYFRETTTGHCIITGRKNYESIPSKYRPLANRTNIIVTRNKDYSVENGAIVEHSIEEAIAYAKGTGEEEVFIIGGGQIYQECLKKNLVDKMYVTHVTALFEADTFFPEIETGAWREGDKVLLGAEPFPAEVTVYTKK
ncbi:dihydrofolate reductase [Salibacteraceae bacterium]|jgi:dihydrofolate reductase|nr:dihydrofolate reductase [Salibacteraceae bacterium]